MTSRFPFLLVIAAICFSFCHGNASVVCFESEREALLKFKNDLIDDSNSLSSWVEGGDCCQWIGVVCHNLTGHVDQLNLAAPIGDIDAPDDAESEAYYGSSMLGGKINPSLLHLKHLTSLDLSNNNFDSIQIPEFFGLLESLTYLNLSGATFQGEIPHSLGNLSKLEYLDLRGDSWIEAKSLEWVSGLSSLKYLDLSNVDLHEVTNWLQVSFKLPSLLELHLSGCNLVDDPSPVSTFNSTKSLAFLDLSFNLLSSVPVSIFSLRGLVSIDLSENSLEGPIPNYFGNMSFLEVVDLSQNSLNSSVPNSLFSLSHLQSLRLSDNMLQGRLPTSLENLCNLKEMDLSDNRIDQNISEILQSLSRCSLESFEYLSMGNNQLSGHLTDQIGKFKSLGYLSLPGNNISGPIPLSIGELSFLNVFDVSENQLTGTFPPSFGNLENLETLNVKQNLLEGVVSETHFSNLTRLTKLKASDNMLRFEPNSSWIPSFQCKTIELSGWNLGPKFPQWLKFQKGLFELDISRAGISDVIPDWFLNISDQFKHVNLSSNQLTGGISYLNVRKTIDLSSNRFTGPLPKVFPALRNLLLSNNSFSGSLSQLVCDSLTTGEMASLAIDTNLLSGEIPDCWDGWNKLGYLNLGNNNLTGKIPPSFGYANPLMLNLRNNSLSGELPSTMQNSTDLRVLDLSENHFSGSVPAWIGEKLERLAVLSLRSNNFDGRIPRQMCALQSLQNLDLANNNISGAIPKCFSNLTAMATQVHDDDTWGYFSPDINFFLSALLALKGRVVEYTTTLQLVSSMDLSANRLTGAIPKELGTLIDLRSLNVSGNLLTGNIPDNIGSNLKTMESLDLSTNRLNGEIPWSFSKLNFLNHFNVSYNNLTGQIPTSTQLQSFENSSYVGNHLCGPPLTKSCTTERVPVDVTNNNGGSSEENNWWSKVKGIYVSIFVGFIMGFWGVVAPLFLSKSWRVTYYQKLDHFGRKLYVCS